MNVNSDAVNILTAIRAVVISHSAQSFSLCRKGAVAGCVCLPNKNTLCLSTVTEYKEQLCVVMSSSLHEETVSHTGVPDFFFLTAPELFAHPFILFIEAELCELHFGFLDLCLIPLLM